MGFAQPISEVDVVVTYKYVDAIYRATIADRMTGENICDYDEVHEADSVEDALSLLLTHTCTHLGEIEDAGVLLNGITAAKPATSSVGVKRGRGRPKKTDAALPTPAVPAKRGRPPKLTTTDTTASHATQAMSTDTVIKRGRGRPRKFDVNLAASSSMEEAQGSTNAVIKRGRGRPKKSDAGVPVDSEVLQGDTPQVVKRGRGRPRKSDATPASGSKRPAAALEDDEHGDDTPKKSQRMTSELSSASADELGEENGGNAPFTPRIYLPTYLSKHARIVYHCIHSGPDGSNTTVDVVTRTGLPSEVVNDALVELAQKGGIKLDDEVTSNEWKILDEWEDEEE